MDSLIAQEFTSADNINGHKSDLVNLISLARLEPDLRHFKGLTQQVQHVFNILCTCTVGSSQSLSEDGFWWT